MEFVSACTGATPVATLDEFTDAKLGQAEKLVCEDGVTYLTISEEQAIASRTCCILVRGANKLVLDEADRSLHDALCSVRSLIKQPFLVPGGAACEIEVAKVLYNFADTLKGSDSYVVKAYADAFEVIPLTLAENAGVNPIRAVTELRQAHIDGKTWGLDVTNNGTVVDMVALDVVQPILVTSSMVGLATETARMILKIDDIVIGR